MTKLLLLAGVPGAGKTTWAHSLFPLKYTVIGPSEKPRLEDLLNHNVDTIIDGAAGLSRVYRRELLETCEKFGAEPHLVLFKNVLEATTRNASQGEDGWSENMMEIAMDMYYDTLAEVVQEPWKSVTKVESYQWNV